MKKLRTKRSTTPATRPLADAFRLWLSPSLRDVPADLGLGDRVMRIAVATWNACAKADTASEARQKLPQAQTGEAAVASKLIDGLVQRFFRRHPAERRVLVDAQVVQAEAGSPGGALKHRVGVAFHLNDEQARAAGTKVPTRAVALAAPAPSTAKSSKAKKRAKAQKTPVHDPACHMEGRAPDDAAFEELACTLLHFGRPVWAALGTAPDSAAVHAAAAAVLTAWERGISEPDIDPMYDSHVKAATAELESLAPGQGAPLCAALFNARRAVHGEDLRMPGNVSLGHQAGTDRYVLTIDVDGMLMPTGDVQ